MTDYVCVYNPDVLLPCDIGNGGYCPLKKDFVSATKTNIEWRDKCEFCHEQKDGRRAPVHFPEDGKTMMEVMFEQTLKPLIKELYELKDRVKDLERMATGSPEKCCGTCGYWYSGFCQCPNPSSRGGNPAEWYVMKAHDGHDCHCWMEKT